MATAKNYLLLAIWALCALGTLAVGAMLWNLASHPLTENSPWEAWPIYCMPFLVMAVSGMLSIQRLWLLILNACVTGLTFLMITS